MIKLGRLLEFLHLHTCSLLLSRAQMVRLSSLMSSISLSGSSLVIGGNVTLFLRVRKDMQICSPRAFRSLKFAVLLLRRRSREGGLDLDLKLFFLTDRVGEWPCEGWRRTLASVGEGEVLVGYGRGGAEMLGAAAKLRRKFCVGVALSLSLAKDFCKSVSSAFERIRLKGWTDENICLGDDSSLLVVL